jgi:hypothetical protein
MLRTVLRRRFNRRTRMNIILGMIGVGFAVGLGFAFFGY